MNKYRVALLVEAKDAEEAGAFVGTLGAPKHLQWDQPLHSETLEIEPLEETLSQSTIDAITEHIQRRREDPEFMARLNQITEENALLLERLADHATSDLGRPRLYFLLIRSGSLDQLVVHASADSGFIGRIACEEFGGEPDGPGSFDDVVVPLTRRKAGVSYSIPGLSTFAVGFHSGAVPSAKILQLGLRCSEEQARHLRALVERHQEHSRGDNSHKKARTYLVVEQVAQEAEELIPVCPRCLSEEVGEAENAADTERWGCANCGARFERPVQASS